MNSNRHFVHRAIALLGLCAAGGALAQEPNPYYVGIAQAFTHESNLFRVATGQPETSDMYSTTSLLAGINQPISRQRFFADVAARYNHYRDNSQLNNTGYGVGVGLDWETIENLSGRVSYNLNDALASFGADQGPALTTKNMEKSQEFYARAQYGRVSTLSLEGVFTHRELDYSAPEFAYEEYKQDAFSLGLLYRPSGLLTLGAAGRYTKGKYPFAVEPAPGVFQQDNFTRKDLDLTAVWVPTGLSTVSARLSYTKETHEAVAARDLSGGTGAISWDYKPTGKLAFNTALVRDTGAESSFYRPGQGGVGSIGNNSQLSTSVLFRGLYEATAKIQVELNARYVERDLVNSFALASGATATQAGTDKLGALKLGLNYAPLRSVLLGCSVAYERRGSSSAVSYPYAVHIASCSGQFKLQ
jgi:hypothetical protein